MTICISAICTGDKNEFIVFAVDHMITTNVGQFEQDIMKYESIKSNTIGMLAEMHY